MSESQKEILEAIEEEIASAPSEKITSEKLLLEWVTSVTVKKEKEGEG